MQRLLVILLALSFSAASPAVAGKGDKIVVMTQNQYMGVDLTPVITAPDTNAALIAVLEQLSAANIPARAEKLAELIADRLPHLVGLQEMFRFTCFNVPGPGPDCSDPRVAGAFNDHLVLTEAALLAWNKPYVVAGVVENINFSTVLLPPPLPPLPGFPVDLSTPPDGLPDITVTILDRDVILARTDVPTTIVSFPCVPSRVSVDGCNYSTIASVMAPGLGTIDIERGFVGVDATVDGRSYRFVTTHLEVMSPAPLPPQLPTDVPGGSIQAAQATELNRLVTASLLTDPPPPGTNPIIVGDINSSSEDRLFTDPLFPNPTQLLVPPYTQLTTGVDLFGTPAPGLDAYTDAWELRPGNNPGFTCCQDEDLLNRQSAHDERIDVLFTLAVPKKVKQARVLGSKVSDKTPPPGQRLWPSDHGSVAAELEF